MSRSRQRVRRADTGSAASSVAAGVALVLPLVALLWVSSYAKPKPELFGFPFFYWYQLLWVIITAVLTFIAYLFVRRSDVDRGDERQAERDRGEQR